jgi:hypothetical protein
MQYWNDSPTRRAFLHLAHAAMHSTMERISPGLPPAQFDPPATESRPPTRWKIASEIHRHMTRDKASPDVAVMLHLRSCYVSKAAILTLPVQLVSVENRSPS